LRVGLWSIVLVVAKQIFQLLDCVAQAISAASADVLPKSWPSASTLAAHNLSLKKIPSATRVARADHAPTAPRAATAIQSPSWPTTGSSSTAQPTMPGGVNSPVRAFRSLGGTPRFIERAQGPYSWDVDGLRYTDYIGS
jgi:hypothetical protein